MPAIPSWTVAGAFGIARTTGTPSRDPLLDVRRRDGGRDRDEGLLRREVLPDLAEQDVDVLRLDGDDDDARRRLTAAALSEVASAPWRSCSSAIHSSRRAVTTTSEGSRQPELSRPERRASPIRPPPRMAILRELMAEA